MFRTAALAAAFCLTAGTVFAAAEDYTVDTTHAQVVFSYNHLGFSTTTGLFSDITGTVAFDAADPAASSVKVSFPISTLFTGFGDRDKHFLSADLFNQAVNPTVTFESTAIKVTGDKTAEITGNLTLNGITKEVVLDTVLSQQGNHPMMNKPWLGFDAKTTLKRSDFNVGIFAPAVSDEVAVTISIEAMKAE